jgi:hypothetical protein
VATLALDRPAVRADPVGDRLLRWAVTFFAAGVLVHGADHVLRGVDAISRDVFWAGTAAIALEVGVVVLGCQRHRLAPLAAAVAGVSLATGYVVVHFLPSRGWLSDALSSGIDVSARSWFAASLEVVAATVLGVVGVVVLRRRGGLSSAAVAYEAERPLRRALIEPVVLAMIAGNAAIVAISLTQL